MKYNPKIHKRKSIRLKGYDYSQAGLYFITICLQDRKCLFGNIENGEMILNDAGHMVNKWYYELENKFPKIKCHEMVVMPNHFHCIIENVGAVGADLSVSPNIQVSIKIKLPVEQITGEQITGEQIPVEQIPGEQIPVEQIPVEQITGEQIPVEQITGEQITGEQITGEQIPVEQIPVEQIPGEQITGEQITGEQIHSPLHRVVQWFKTMTTNEYIRGVKQMGWQPFDRKLWQRNYWEIIIRNQQSYQRISNYIINNPKN
ncbi:MAG: transposase [bacterium]|nr:transposase [bacterium]